MHHALMPLVLFAVANASLPSFFVADVECLLQESYECERATSVFFFFFGRTNGGGICRETLCFGLNNDGV